MSGPADLEAGRRPSEAPHSFSCPGAVPLLASPFLEAAGDTA